MSKTITIFWPEKVPPDIDEVQFSYDFCRCTSRKLCNEVFLSSHTWIDAPVDKYGEQVSAGITADMTLVVTDPETVLSPMALKSMIKSLGDSHGACGPVYNQSDFPSQLAELPVPYVNMATYLEMVSVLSQKEGKRLLSVDALDPSCILYKTDYLKGLIRDGYSLGGRGKAIVDKHALIHRFGDYYNGKREDLVSLVPQGVKNVLDVGCAMGGYGKHLRRERPDILITGVEMNRLMAGFARRYYDEVITSPIEDAHFPDSFDHINCGDILEHLQNPWDMLKRFHDLLRPNGFLVLSVPNAGHWSVVRDLLQGKFEYIPVGLLCITHVRWFTQTSIRKAIEEAGFVIDVFRRETYPPTEKGEVFIHSMSELGWGDEASLRTNEFTIRAVKSK
jgi:2-polyprenyl-3-methyl-5-hydroxy-6-metoxy-1,4-benzoquinol methylase